MATISFNGTTLRILITGTGDLSVSAKEIYSAWKDWVAAGNAGFPAAFRSVGGDPLGGGTYAGDYFFLQNADGWRIAPEEKDHILTISGNLYGENVATDVFVPTAGDYNVQIRLALSQLTQSVSTSGGSAPTANENADALLDRSNGVESGITPRQALRILSAALGGLVSGAESGTITFKAAGGATDRIVATVDEHGNRTIVTLDAD